MFTIRPYVAADAKVWDAVVARSRNGNLLHRRGYMDYHADRFVDCSLLIERDNQAIAVFPATRQQHVVVSHGGLTYAGLIATEALRAEATLAVFDAIGEHYRNTQATSLIYKPVPHVFHRYPIEEDLYALHRVGAKLVRRDISSVIALDSSIGYAPMRRRSIRHASRQGITLHTGGDPAAFHALLADVLRRHGAVPTHSLQELQLLQARFPSDIVLHQAYHEDSLVAGVIAYDLGHAVHAQYIAASQRGRELGALDMLFDALITNTYAPKRYFSFGISTEQAGRVLNGSLIAQKEYFGARGVVHDCYEWALA